MTVTDNDFLDLQDKYLALKKTVDILLTNLGDPSTMVPGTVNFGGNLFASPVGMVARRQKFQWPAEVITNQINGGSGAVPTGSPDMDLNNDGTVSILDASILAAKYTPPKGSGWVWVETPDNIIYPGSSPSPQSYVFGLTAYAPNAYMTESTSVRLGSTGTAGTAEIVPHSAKSTALSQADIRLRGAVWQTATTLTQISADTNDYEVGENICSVFRISSDAARNITGIVAPTTNTTFTPNAWWLILLNAGSFNITLKDSSASSSAANRFALDADIVLKPDQGCFLMYDSASTVWRAIAYPSTAGGSSMPMPPLVGPLTSQPMAGLLAAVAAAAPTSAAWGTANTAILVPVQVTEDCTITKLWVHNGATASGNIDVGVYDSSFAKVITAGSTAQTGTSVVQEFDVANTAITAGLYYIAMALDNTTGTVFRTTTYISQAEAAQSIGMAQMASAFALPSTITPAVITINNAFVPMAGFSISPRTVVT